MKFTFHNLGTIKRTTLDLRPLTVVIGPNNTNKTYLAYCVHGLMATMGIPPRFDLLGHRNDGEWDVSVAISELVSSMQTPGRFDGFALTLREFFQDTYGGMFKATKLELSVDEYDVRSALAAAASKRFELGTSSVTVHSVKRNKKAALQVLRDAVAPSLAREPLTLPAERNALVIAYKVLSARRYRILRDSDRHWRFNFTPEYIEADTRQRALLREQGDIRYPAPIEEFLDFLTDVELAAGSPKNAPSSPFGQLASRIEASIQAGHRTGYEATALGGRELALTVSDSLRLDLYNASSSIKQLAPLLLYLRYRAAPGQLLIIDEPEMNLHPEGQAKLLEALAMLTNLGVHVLLTTHSPYIMAHLNNLIAADASSQPRRKAQAKHLYMADAAAFLAPDAVSAYEMRADGLTSLADPEYGIRWDTLSDVSAELQRRYFAIVEEPEKRAKKQRKK